MATAFKIQNLGVTSNPIQLKQNSEKVPQYHCGCCTRCKENHCDYFNRRVDTSYNRCWLHSEYVKDDDIHYISPPESFFKEIQEEALRRIKKLQRQGIPY